MSYFSTRDLSVGYDGNVLIHDINIDVVRGKILTLIGPNGAGKSTILKSITRHLMKLGGQVYLDGQDVYRWSPREMARQVAVVLTERIDPELMTVEELVAMGRYPYTNALGKLTPEDRRVVAEALDRVNARDLADRYFSTLSDGQRQRVLLARAICQSPQLIVLDEPTSFLDIRHKIELLSILRQMSREQGVTVIMSLHEIDLATKVSDYILCVKGDTIAAFGPPEEIFRKDTIDRLYGIEHGAYNLLFGSVELASPPGAPEVFVIGGGGSGIPIYRALQRAGVPFAAGVLPENDVDFFVAGSLAAQVVSVPPYQPVDEAALSRARALMAACGRVLCPLSAFGPANEGNRLLREEAAAQGLLLSPAAEQALLRGE